MELEYYNGLGSYFLASKEESNVESGLPHLSGSEKLNYVWNSGSKMLKIVLKYLCIYQASLPVPHDILVASG